MHKQTQHIKGNLPFEEYTTSYKLCEFQQKVGDTDLVI
jgi:hypothetical protein